MAVKVPPASLAHLARAPLKVAVAQVRYAPIHAVEKRDLVADFEARLDRRYVAEDAQTSQRITIQVGPSPAIPSIESPIADTVWPFRDDERGYSVSLGNSSLAVEADASYHDFPQFLREFKTAVESCAEVFEPKRETRLGLRYINEIVDERLREDIRSVISEGLAAPVGKTIRAGLLGSFAEYRVAEKLGVFAIRHGLVSDSMYLLDFDYFSETQRDFDPNGIVKTVEGFHDLIEPFFVWSLDKSYLQELSEASKEN